MPSRWLEERLDRKRKEGNQQKPQEICFEKAMEKPQPPFRSVRSLFFFVFKTPSDQQSLGMSPQLRPQRHGGALALGLDIVVFTVGNGSKRCHPNGDQQVVGSIFPFSKPVFFGTLLTHSQVLCILSTHKSFQIRTAPVNHDLLLLSITPIP